MELSIDTEYKFKRDEIINSLQILHSSYEEVFENVVNLAAMTCAAPAAMIIFANGNDGWIKASTGISFDSVHQFDTILDLFVSHSQPVLIADTFNSSVKQLPLFATEGFRFYAGAPIISHEVVIGHVVVMDYMERSLTLQQLKTFETLGRHASLLLLGRTQIIKHIEAEQELKNTEEQIRTIFYNAVNAVVVMDADGLITQWNPKAETIFGWPVAEAIGKDFCSLCLLEQYWYICKGTLTSEGKRSYPTETVEATAIRKDGSQFEIDLGLSSALINCKDYHIAFVSDITDRKQVTAQLDKQKEFYENILNMLPTDIAVFDANHKYLFVNPGAISNPEYRKFIVGKDDYEYAAYRNRDITVAHTRRAQFLQVKNTGKEIRWEDSMANPEGKVITHLRRMFPVHNESGELTYVIGFGMDITDRKVLEEKQSALVNQLSAQNAQLIDFCNIVSHNLRGPLVNMSMLVQFIEEAEDQDEQRFLISKLQPVIDNLHTTFNELVESIQIKQDLEIQSERISLCDCIQRTLEGLEVEINKSEAMIETDFQEASELNYPAKYLFSIFHNLIGNSLKYRSPDRKPIIRVATKKHNNSVILSVSDNGLGVDTEKHKDNLFKIGKVFHRHPNAKGFGLFMTKTQVEAMNDKIWVESAPDKGATFFVEFKNQAI